MKPFFLTFMLFLSLLAMSQTGKSLLQLQQEFNLITIAQRGENRFNKYRLEYFHNDRWIPLVSSENKDVIKMHRFENVYGNKVRILIDEFGKPPVIAEFGVYNERK